MAFRWSERTSVEPMVAFKRDTKIVISYSWLCGTYHLIYVVRTVYDINRQDIINTIYQSIAISIEQHLLIQ